MNASSLFYFSGKILRYSFDATNLEWMNYRSVSSEALSAVKRRTHELKTLPESFDAVVAGTKTYEIRKCEDREFSVGDVLVLREFVPEGGYTGRDCWVAVTYLTPPSKFGLPSDICVMAIRKL